MKRAAWVGLLSALFALPAAAQAPDLVASAVVSPATAALDAQVNLSATIRNAGDAAVGGELEYTWFISTDRAVTISDLPISTRMTPMNLMPGQSVNLLDTVMIPMGLLVGAHWIGVCANYDSTGNPGFVVAESSFANNCAQSALPVVLTSSTVTIATPSMLPAATQHGPYGLRLEARGGTGTYDWTLEAGAMLPLGLRLDANGDLRGTPALVGSTTFGVKVTSGTATATAQLTLVVTAGTIPLAVVDQDLPSAEFGRSYDAPLVATGGKPPYHWAPAPQAVVPAGLFVTPDGRVSGLPSEAGTFTFSVEVTDGDMARASRPVRLRVTTPAGLHVAVRKLESAYLQRDYVQALTAVGGKMPYTWTVLAIQQLPQDVTQVPGPVLTDFPENFGLRLEGNSLRGAPKMAGLWALTLRVTDANSAEDYTKLLLNVSYLDPIAIVTSSLPDAFIMSDYQVRVSHNRQIEANTAIYSLPCVQVASSTASFSCQPTTAKEMMPAGLTLREDGTIIGNPITGALGTYSFLIAVTDDSGRRDVRSLSITLRPEKVAPGGCAGTGLAGPSLLLSLFVLAGIRRKRVAP